MNLNLEHFVKHTTATYERLSQLESRQENGFGILPKTNGNGDVSTYLEEWRTAVNELRAQYENLIIMRTEIEKQQNRYREIFDLSAESYIVTDADCLILEANCAAVSLLNASRNTLLNRSLTFYVTPNDRFKLRDALSITRTNDKASLKDIQLSLGENEPILVDVTLCVSKQLFSDETVFIWMLHQKRTVEARTSNVEIRSTRPSLSGNLSYGSDLSSIKNTPDKVAGFITANALLANLKENDLKALLPHLSIVKMQCGQVLQEPNAPLEYAYFPINSVISIFSLMRDGKGAEAAVIGHEGMVGVRFLLGEVRTPNLILSQVPGLALRLSSAVLKEAIKNCPALSEVLNHYIQVRLIQTSQLVACNGLHSLDQRLCRALLMIQDRALLATLPVTHESLAALLGVRRSGVTVAARLLSKDQIIGNRRGKITILNRQKLEANACECYRQLKEEEERVLGLK